MRLATCLILLTYCLAASGQDISNPRRYMFVADTLEPVIDVVDLRSEEVVYRIKTETLVDHVLVTPYAPVLIYANIEAQSVSFYNLESKTLARTLQLDLIPRHLVIDTSGRRVAVTDSQEGGFALLSAYGFSVEFELPDFPATGDVLFDPNDVDIYFSDVSRGQVGVLDMNLRRIFEIPVLDAPGDGLSSPSRSLDGRYIYVANTDSGEVFGINAFNRTVYKTFRNGAAPARPYTTPEGLFLYVMDERTGRFSVFDQQRFEPWAEVELEGGADLVSVGRFDRLNLLSSTMHRAYGIYDNIERRMVSRGEFPGTPLDSQGAADGRTAYVAFRDRPEVAVIDIETQKVRFIAAVEHGVADFVVGLTNNVCH